MLRVIAARWAADGHAVEVLSTQPSYRDRGAASLPSREQLDGFLVRRASLLNEHRRHGGRVARVINVAAFSVKVAWRVLVGGYDVVMTSTSPPVVLGWAVAIAAGIRRTSFVYHCMDVHPEIGRLSGDFARPVVYRRLRAMDTKTCQRAEAVVVLSEDMADALQHRPGAGVVRTTVIQNIDLPDLAEHTDADRLQDRPPHSLRVVFTGNVGRFQALDVVLTALSRVPRGRCHLVVMGDGQALVGLREQSERLGLDDDVRFVAHDSVATARALIRSADLCLVSLAPGIEALAFPSKTMTYLAEGKPVLAVIEPGCELARLVTEEDVGVVAPVADVQAVADAITKLSADSDLVAALQESSRMRGPKLCDQAQIMDAWSGLLIGTARRNHA
jgi:glycosyltransferase involved in cell wall biosynthesis